jgi:hypothetical protein
MCYILVVPHSVWFSSSMNVKISIVLFGVIPPILINVGLAPTWEHLSLHFCCQDRIRTCMRNFLGPSPMARCPLVDISVYQFRHLTKFRFLKLIPNGVKKLHLICFLLTSVTKTPNLLGEG